MVKEADEGPNYIHGRKANRTQTYISDEAKKQLRITAAMNDCTMEELLDWIFIYKCSYNDTNGQPMTIAGMKLKAYSEPE